MLLAQLHTPFDTLPLDFFQAINKKLQPAFPAIMAKILRPPSALSVR